MANKWAISANLWNMAGLKNEKQKNQKKFSENNFYSKAKIFRKKFFEKTAWRMGAAKGMPPIQQYRRMIYAQNGRIARILLLVLSIKREYNV